MTNVGKRSNDYPVREYIQDEMLVWKRYAPRKRLKI